MGRIYKLHGGSSSQYARTFRSYSNMNRLQIASLLVALWCIGGGVSAGLLPGGISGGGYQYNRPSGVGFGGGDSGRRGYEESIDRFGGFGATAFGGRSSSTYGAPGFGGFGGPVGGSGGGGYRGRPLDSYAAPGFGNYQGSGGYQGYQGDGNYQRYNNEDNRPRPYSFQYEVRDPASGNDYGQQESSDGNAVRGEYRVLLPDSRTQIVKYTADDINGYNADVQYEGQAQFPRGLAGGGYQVGGAAYQGGFGTGGYQPGRGGYGGLAGGFGSGIFGGGTGNQYLPPGGGYGK